MAAPVTTAHLIEDGFDTARYLFTASFTDTQESTAQKIDVSSLAYSDPDGTPTVTIEAMKWNVSGTGSITVLHDGSPDVTAAILSGHGEIDGGNFADAGSDVLFTTTGFASGSTYQVELTVRKQDGFLKVPYADTATVDETTYITGDTITAEVTFSGPVFLKGIPTLEIDLNNTTVEAVCTSEPNQEHDSLTFEYVVTEEDQAEEAEVAFGEILLSGSASITGGFAQGDARLTGFTSDLATVTVNAEEE